MLHFQRLFDIFLTAVFPYKCLRCGNFFEPPRPDKRCGAVASATLRALLERDERTRFKQLMAPFLCPECVADFVPLTPLFCPMCDDTMQGEPETEEDPLSVVPQEVAGRIRSVRAVGVYDKALLGLIHGFKYRGYLQLAVPLGLLLLTLFLDHYGSCSCQERENDFGVDVIVPVPLHARRFRKRGYNQAYLLVSHWMEWLKALTGSRPHMEMEREALVKIRHTPSQTRFGREARLRNVKDAYRLKHPPGMKGKRVLLVDDVYTTGATLEECARVLMEGGAARVDALTVARALKPLPCKQKSNELEQIFSDVADKTL